MGPSHPRAIQQLSFFNDAAQWVGVGAGGKNPPFRSCKDNNYDPSKKITMI
jgi:hypothetical protein